jgi:hypothetical protein
VRFTPGHIHGSSLPRDDIEYRPPAENVLGVACGFEFATPLDDVSQVFNGVDNPGTVGLPYVHLPGWQQQFLITWLIVNKQVWSQLTSAQQALTYSVARDHVLDSYGELYRVKRGVQPNMRFDDWTSPTGETWKAPR